MKKILLTLVYTAIAFAGFAQTTLSPTEKALTDTICNCLVNVNVDKINSKQEAVNSFTNCFGKYTPLLMKFADEKHIDVTDHVAMREIGIDIGKDLLKENCTAFTKISIKMVQSEQSDEKETTSTGIFKHIEFKGFNYIVITENNNEKSFIWLKQFAGSEKFMNNTAALIGKKIRITWHEIEVYLPQAKGYYKIKEILAVDFL